jgi:hypothetical protein
VEDQQAERLRAEIARELAANLGVTTEEIAFSLDTLAADNQWAGSLSSLKIQCSFKKISPTLIHLVVNAYYAREGKPTMTTLERDISWDEVPRDVRHDFIRSGEKELHYALGKSMQEAATQGGTL